MDQVLENNFYSKKKVLITDTGFKTTATLVSNNSDLKFMVYLTTLLTQPL